MLKRGAFCCCLLFIVIVSGCRINDRGVDPGLENNPNHQFYAHNHQRGEGFGFWNQQRDRKNPIANMVTRDQRPGRGMNGIVDQRPNIMNRRISKYDANNRHKQEISPLSLGDHDNGRQQLSMELMQRLDVLDVRIVSYENNLLIAIDCETNNQEQIKEEARSLALDQFPNKDIIVVTDRQAVDRLRFLEDGSTN